VLPEINMTNANAHAFLRLLGLEQPTKAFGRSLTFPEFASASPGY
jgi:hypothetical protein